FDPVNDDVLQHRARVHEATLRIGNQSYRYLIMPGITALPVATMEMVARFAAAGGVVVALGERPREAVGLAEYPHGDARVSELAARLFGAIPATPEQRTYFLPGYKIGETEPRRDWEFNPPPG